MAFLDIEPWTPQPTPRQRPANYYEFTPEPEEIEDLALEKIIYSSLLFLTVISLVILIATSV